MSVSASRLCRVMAFAVAVSAAAACSDRRTAERADSDLSHDLALAGQMNAQPALQDSAVANHVQAAPQQPTAQLQLQVPQRMPASQRLQAAPPLATQVARQPDSAAMAAVPAPAPVARVVGTGTGIALSSGMRVCTSTNKVGDKLVATVTSPVTGSGGAMVPTGSRVVLEVAQVNARTAPDGSAIVFKPTMIYVDGAAYPITGDIVSTSPPQQVEVPNAGASDKEKLVGGAIAGAILGQILGRNTKSTVIGAAAGAATGAVVAKVQKSYQACLPEGSALTLTLSSPLTMN